MEPKSFVVGKTRSGIWFLQFYIQRICTRTEEGLVAKSPLSSAPLPPPTIHSNPASQTNLFQEVPFLTRTLHCQNAQKSLILGPWRLILMLSVQGRQLSYNRFDVSDYENVTQFRDGRKWFVLNV